MHYAQYTFHCRTYALCSHLGLAHSCGWQVSLVLLPLEDAEDPTEKLRSLKAKFKCASCRAYCSLQVVKARSKGVAARICAQFVQLRCPHCVADPYAVSDQRLCSAGLLSVAT